ncbi:MAG: acetyl-CoA carboxylase biotin carboxyl carrier protein subunit [Alphaproteobacteria bacterium]|nr:acetyl-CoA carboxylase biotin carboxyl carrier protein subunit [Alphaproteobacteria bacterium]
MSFRSNVESMSKIMDEMGITELELERQFLFGVYRKHIHLSKLQGTVVAPAACTPISTEATTVKNTQAVSVQASGHTLKSPMVGVAYLAPEPGSKPFVTVGSQVKSGDTIALIEAMKTFNPIKSDKDGTVREILVSDGQAVEFDQPIIVIE